MSNRLQIVTWKWDNGIHPKKNMKFTSTHVNTMKNMLRRNLTIPYDLVCITDDDCGIDDDIRIISLWDDHRNKEGCFVRLKCFTKEMKDIIGPRFASIDLDCVILKNIDHIFSREEDFIIWGDAIRDFRYCGSLFMMDAGAREKEVWGTFNPDDYHKAQTIRGLHYRHGTDQYHISKNLTDEAEFTSDSDGIYNFRTDIYLEEIANATDSLKRRIRVANKRLTELTKEIISSESKIDRGKIKKKRRTDELNNIIEKNKEELSVLKKVRERLGQLKDSVKYRVKNDPKLPNNASIVFFNGKFDPSQKVLQDKFLWIKENWR